MEIGNQIKALRGQRGLTQETVASALGVTAQAVSKWENGAAVPDIALLPAISAYFGVTIDALFALTDELRVERIKNMLWDNRDIEEAVLDREAEFLQDKARREPERGETLMMLAWIENFKAQAHRRRAEYYAKESLRRDPDSKDAHVELAEAMDVPCPDWYCATHAAYIDWYRDFIAKNPTVWRAYMWLIDALILDRRFDEAEAWCERMGEVDHTFRTPDYRARIAWARGDRKGARELWEQECRDFPDEWMVWSNRDDGLAAEGSMRRPSSATGRTSATRPILRPSPTPIWPSPRSASAWVTSLPPSPPTRSLSPPSGTTGTSPAARRWTPSAGRSTGSGRSSDRPGKAERFSTKNLIDKPAFPVYNQIGNAMKGASNLFSPAQRDPGGWKGEGSGRRIRPGAAHRKLFASRLRRVRPIERVGSWTP